MANEIVELYERAQDRQRGFCSPWDPELLLTGVPDSREVSLIENPISTIERIFGLQEAYLAAETEYGYHEIDVHTTIEDEKATTKRAIMALQIATEQFIQAIEKYAADIDRQIMNAKIFAAEIENQQLLLLETGRTDLAEERAIIQVKETQARIILETIERNFVELDILKINLEVARGYVRKLLAELDVTRAELEIVKSLIEQAMATVREAEIKANIANIFADILTKQLIKTEYDVTKAEIVAGFAFIQERLTSLLELSGLKRAQEDLRTSIEEAIQRGISEQTVLEIREDTLRKHTVEADKRVLEYDEQKTLEGLALEETSKTTLADLEKTAAETGGGEDKTEIEKRTWAIELTEAAETALAKKRWMYSDDASFIHEHLGKE